MDDFKFELNKRGVRDLLRSDYVLYVVNQEATRILAECGEGYAMSSTTGRNRALAQVYPVTTEAMYDNSEHNTLLKSFK